MVLLKALLVVSGLAYGASLNLNTDANARNNLTQVMERSVVSVGHSVFLKLSIFYSPQHKKHLGEKTSVESYLNEFVKKINKILLTQKRILQVQFILVNSSLWKEARRALTHDKGALDAELLKAILKVYGRRFAKKWKEHHPHKSIAAVLFLTPQTIRNVEKDEEEIGIAGQIGGICLPEHFVAAAQDKPGKYTGVKSAARQLSTLMGSVYDGEGPSPKHLVPGSDGARGCKYNDGNLMGDPERWKDSVEISRCTAHEYIMGIRQRGPGCYSLDSTKNIESNAIPY